MAGNQSVGDQEMQQRTLNIAIAANAGLGLLLSGIVIGSVASSANAESTSTPSTRAGGTITACVNKKSKAMRLTSSCSKNETKVSWNAQGSTGPMGLQGSTGPQGPQGAQGQQGQQGQQGAKGAPGLDGTSANGLPPGTTFLSRFSCPVGTTPQGSVYVFTEDPATKFSLWQVGSTTGLNKPASTTVQACAIPF